MESWLRGRILSMLGLKGEEGGGEFRVAVL